VELIGPIFTKAHPSFSRPFKSLFAFNFYIEGKRNLELLVNKFYCQKWRELTKLRKQLFCVEAPIYNFINSYLLFMQSLGCPIHPRGSTLPIRAHIRTLIYGY